MSVVIGKTEEEQVRKGDRHDTQRPRHVHDGSGRDVSLRVRSVERVTPVPERRDPNLLQTLDNASSSDPDFGRSSGFFTKVETEEEESSSRGNSVTVGRDSGNGLSWRGEHSSEGWESNEDESNGEPGV